MFLFVMPFAIISMAQEADSTSGTSHWKTGGMGSLSFSQLSLTNWAAGGENSLSGVAILNLHANYKKDKTTWDNTLDMAYGLLKQGDDAIIKSDDKIDFSSKYGRYTFKNFYYTALLGFKTQFAPGYQNPEDSVRLSDFLAPAYLNVAIGMDYKPNDHFSLFVSPITGKTTIVNDDSLSNRGAFGVEPGDKIRYEFGGYIKLGLNYDIMENVNLQTKMDLFSNYIDNPQNIDVNWETMIAMKINEYLSASLSTTLIYDDDIMIQVAEDNSGPRIQFKELFTLGLSYKF